MNLKFDFHSPNFPKMRLEQYQYSEMRNTNIRASITKVRRENFHHFGDFLNNCFFLHFKKLLAKKANRQDHEEQYG